MGFKIFIRCIKQVYQNWNVAFRLSWFWVLTFGGLFYWQSITVPQFAPHVESISATSFIIQTVLAFIIGIVRTTSVAVGWHRYILRGKMPSRFHVIKRNWPNLAYFLMGFQISIILLIVFIPISLFLVPIITPNIIEVSHGFDIIPSSQLSLYLITIILNIIFVWLFLRLRLALPAIAVGEDIRLGSSFNITRPVKYHLMVTAALIIFLMSFPNLMLYVAVNHFSLSLTFNNIGLILFFGIFNWFSFFVGVGVLTVTYNQLYEKSEI